MPALWLATAFLGSALLFAVEPMIARMLLPRLGGAPAVWTTCVLFFQAALLAGYAYAHRVGDLAPRVQLPLHAAVLALALAALPFRLPAGDPGATPALWLLGALAVAIGLPFVALAAGAPLLQRWLSRSGLRGARDPYFLYSASNAGSLAALAAYPFLIEPSFGLEEQRRLWSRGYGLYLVLLLACAAAAWRAGGPDPAAAGGAASEPDAARDEGPGRRLRLRWIALAAVPSSLMLGVTSFVSADVAAVPFLWVVPLALYLLTFVFAFARRNPLHERVTARLLPVAAVVFALIWLTKATEPVALVAGGHLAAFFFAAMACHGELARLRPEPRHLTGYYLLIGVGGVIGGGVNTLVAPALLTDVYEYPAAFVAACLLAPGRARAGRERGGGGRKAALRRDVLPALAAGLSTLAAVALAGSRSAGDPVRMALTAGLPALLVYLSSERRLRFGLALLAVIWAGSFDTALRGRPRLALRSFFGVHRVTLDRGPAESWNALYHGTTLHGAQLASAESGAPLHPREPLGYYTRSSPIGRLLRSYASATSPGRVGLVGLGAGALLAYAEPGQRWTAFEIDPAVARIAADEAHFSYLSAARARGAAVDVVLGDARVRLARTDATFDLLAVDAFSGGAVPLHLLTREAFALYLARLGDGGVLAVHVSNRHFDLGRLVRATAADLALAAAVEDDPRASRGGPRLGSSWAFAARTPEALRARGLAPQPAPTGGPRGWTDDYWDLWAVMTHGRP